MNLLSTGNGLGKTIGAINLIGNIIYGPQNRYFDTPFFNNLKIPKRGRIVSNVNNIKENIVPEMKSWFPRGKYKLGVVGVY